MQGVRSTSDVTIVPAASACGPPCMACIHCTGVCHNSMKNITTWNTLLAANLTWLLRGVTASPACRADTGTRCRCCTAAAVWRLLLLLLRLLAVARRLLGSLQLQLWRLFRCGGCVAA